MPSREPAEVIGSLPSEREPERVHDYKLASPLVLHEAIRAQGAEEMARSTRSLLWSGLAGGLSMALSALFAALLHAHLPASPWRSLVTGLGFATGFVIVMVGRHGLVTENALTTLLPTLSHSTGSMVLRTLRVWGALLTGNIVAISVLALVFARTDVLSHDVKQSLADLGTELLGATFTTQLLRAVLAGWMIALAVWVAPAAGAARVVTTTLLTWAVAVAQFGHIVSGSGETLVAVFMGRVSLADYVTGFFLPVLLGNMLGGAVLVAALNHAQVAHEEKELPRKAQERAGRPSLSM